MATIYGSPAGGAWGTAATWSSTSGGSTGGTVPTSSDDVVLDASSGSITVGASSQCRSLDCNSGDAAGAYTNTLTIGAFTLFIGSSTAPASAVALRLSSGMTFVTSAGSGVITFQSTSATQTTFTSASKTFGYVTFSGTGGSWSLVDGFTTAVASVVTLTAGTLTTNNQACSWGSFLWGVGTKTLTLGSSTITMTATSGNAWNANTNSANATVNASTSTIVLSALGGFTGSAFAWHNITYTSGAAGMPITMGGGTIANLTVTGTAVKTGTFDLLSSVTVTGLLTITGNSATNRLLVYGSTPGSSDIFTAGSVSLTNVDFQDIAAGGAAGTWTGTSLGNCQGNSGITFTSAAGTANSYGGVYRYAVAAGNVSATATWATSSGGAAGASVPLPQDTVVCDASSPGTVTNDMLRPCADLTLTNFTHTFSFTTGASIYGSLAIGSSVTWTQTATITYSGRGSQAITTSSKTMASAIVLAPGGTYTVQDSLLLNTTNGVLTHQYGTLNTNGCPISTSGYNGSYTSGSPLRTLTLGASTITLGASAIAWNLNTNTGMTLNAGTSTIVLSGGVLGQFFYGGGLTYNNLSLSSGASVIIVGANTFSTVTVASGATLTLPSTYTTTVANWNVTGQVNGYQQLPGIASQYISSPDSSALDITGSLTLDIKCAPVSWATGNSGLIAKRNATSAYFCRLNGGTLEFFWTTNGSTINQSNATSVTGFAAGSTHWVRVSFVANNGSNQNTASFYTSSDGVTWTQLGTTVTTAGATTIYNNTVPLEIGSESGGGAYNFTGAIYEARIYNSALGSGSGTPVFDANFTTKAFGANSFAESSSNAATVNINGVIAQVGDGRCAINASTAGTQATVSKASGNVSCNYLVLQDCKATGGATFYAGDRSVNVSDNTGWLFVSAPLSTTATSSVSFSDNAVKGSGPPRSAAVAGGVSVGNAATRLLAANTRTAVSSLTTSSVATRTATPVRAAASGLVLSSAAARLLTAARGAVTGLTISSTAARGMTPYPRGATSSVAVSSVAGRVAGGGRAAASTVSTSNVAVRTTSRSLTATSSLAVSSIAARGGTATRMATSPVSISSAAMRTASVRRSGSTSIALSGVASRAGFAGGLTAASSLSTSSAASRTNGRGGAAASSVAISSVASRAHASPRSGSATVTISSAAHRAVADLALAGSSLTVSSTATRANGHMRSAISSLAITSTAPRRLGDGRQAVSSVTLSSAAAAAHSFGRSPASILAVNSTARRARSSYRSAADGWSVSTVAHGARLSLRTTSDSWTITSLVRLLLLPSISLPTTAAISSQSTMATLVTYQAIAKVAATGSVASVAAYSSNAEIATLDI